MTWRPRRGARHNTYPFSLRGTKAKSQRSAQGMRRSVVHWTTTKMPRCRNAPARAGNLRGSGCAFALDLADGEARLRAPWRELSTALPRFPLQVMDHSTPHRHQRQPRVRATHAERFLTGERWGKNPSLGFVSASRRQHSAKASWLLPYQTVKSLDQVRAC